MGVRIKVEKIEKLILKYDNEDFILAFNEEDGKFENVFAIPAERLSAIIELLFRAGNDFQKDNGVGIGFGIGIEEEDDENERDS